MIMPAALQRFIHSRPHLSAAVVLGAVLGPLLPGAWPWMTRLLTAWDAAIWFYLITMGVMMLRADHHDLQRIARRQDERGPVILMTLSIAALFSLVAIVSQLSTLKDLAPVDTGFHYGFVVLTLVGSWFLIGTMFCTHYAHLYYADDNAEKPLVFPDKNLEPNYWDFLYFSFTISVALQTSDVCVRSRLMRKVVLGQSVLCFFFNLAVLGLSINIAASLING
jgi:uncharacterized membrane protein